MKLLVLIPRSAEVRLCLYQTDEKSPAQHEEVARAYCEGGSAAARTSIRSFVRIHGLPDALVFYTPNGGAELPLVSEVGLGVVRHLEAAMSRAPMHIPALLSAIEAAQTECAGVPALMVSGAAFFARLPRSERSYAMDAALCEKLELERTGLHGLFHLAAADLAAATAGLRENARVLSICLEARPEVVALRGGEPMLVTGGVTPLEGLPGQTTCGELDPGMLLILAREQRLGPEEIARFLTHESGLKGLAGRTTTLTEVFETDSAELGLAREVVLYRLLQVAGSALAVLGGLDAIVFSGRHAVVAGKIGAWLRQKLSLIPGNPAPRIEVTHSTLEELVVARAKPSCRADLSNSPVESFT